MALLHSDRRTDRPAGPDVRPPAVPSQRTGDGSSTGTPDVTRRPSRSTSPRRGTVIAVVATTVLALGAGGTSVAVTMQENARRAEVVRQNTAVAAAAQAADVALLARVDVRRAQDVRADRAAEHAARAAAVEQATPQIEAARAALAAAPQATPESRAALQSAIDAAAALTVADPTPFVTTMSDAVTALAAPLQSVAASQAAWQAAEDARIAAEAQAAAARAAAAQRAAAAAAPAPAARAPQTASRSSRAAAAPAAPAASARSRPAAAAAPAAPAPAAAAPAPAAGVGEFSAGALGEAINAYRATKGLPGLGISRSGGLFGHAAAMAQRGEIWHSGADKIVGFTKPASAGTLVQRWAASPAHNAWMLRTDVSSMQVGAATLGGRLYAAVNFG